jgi:hypothetical protein
MTNEYFGEKLHDAPPAFRNAFLTQWELDHTLVLGPEALAALAEEYSLNENEAMAAKVVGLGLAQDCLPGAKPRQPITEFSNG